MEWFESLFLQACSHVITRSRVGDRGQQKCRPVLDVVSTRDLVASYQREVALAFSLAGLQQKLSEGADCVLLLLVQEHQFHTTLQELKRQQDVVLSATLKTDARSSDFANYHVDIAFIRKSRSSSVDNAH